MTADDLRSLRLWYRLQVLPATKRSRVEAYGGDADRMLVECYDRLGELLSDDGPRTLPGMAP